MPMCTQIIDASTGEPRKLPHGWGWWHVQMAYVAICEEAGIKIKETGQIYDDDNVKVWKDAINTGEYTFKEEHCFQDPSDDEVLTFHPGDKYREWYSRF